MSRELFVRDYNIIFAITEEEKKRVYSLRHDVYCEELGFEPVNTSEGIEKDPFDGSALHCLIEKRASGQAVGCARIVLPSDTMESPFYRMPLELKFSSLFESGEHHPDSFQRRDICEISRVAILGDVRKAKSVRASTQESPQSVRTASLLKAGLFLSVLALGKISGRRYGFAMMEPSLARLLSYSGFRFSRISQYLEFNGKRAIYYSDWKEAVGQLCPEMYELYEYIAERFSADFASCDMAMAEIAGYEKT
ncbi:N-acyl amino acid synthase, PEP-CTERM/exosortase system-associated [Kushneria avicenniae]|uniref:N-acyl amino acid synthase, PEP-CTERM/exosortase system-associated n=1 Tax=Kushneria avicenniae TaxID=402385 RepID=A0A1I1JNS4_9GAMM|nr:PEP-CTERM/exosortase system-associated acyltransferase [Kushneria avicenniae]SFC47060.1 N-acyl amino acid synthase, PEP-CTERM/exosortase system-associated [Kushneria avicenniae]